MFLVKKIKTPKINFRTNLTKFNIETLSTKDYLKITSDTIEKINERIQDIFDEKNINDQEYDIVVQDGVLSVVLGKKGSFIISRQTPTKQLWLSSPVTGPWHYKYDVKTKEWVCTKGDLKFFDRLNKEMSPILEVETKF